MHLKNIILTLWLAFVHTTFAQEATDPLLQALKEIGNAQKTSDYLATYRPALLEYMLSTPAPLLCQRLLSLPINDLILLEAAVREGQRTDLHCWPQLEKRIQRYFQRRQQEFAQKIATKSLPTLRPIEVTETYPLIREIDTSEGGRYIYAGMPKGYVALTFDDGPHPSRSPSILKILADYQVHATFFLIGNNAKRHPNIVQKILAQGHSYGSHTVSHPDLTAISFASAQREILNGHQIITNIAGTEMRFFRFPYGAMNSSLRNFLNEQQFANFFWSIDTLDWKLTNPTSLLERIYSEINATQRGIILMHDIHQQTVIVLPQLLRALKEKGYQIVHLRPQGT